MDQMEYATYACPALSKKKDFYSQIKVLYWTSPDILGLTPPILQQNPVYTRDFVFIPIYTARIVFE